MTLRQYFSIAQRWLWLIILATCIAAGISYFTTSSQPKLYQADAKLLVGQSIQSTNPNSGDLVTSQQLALTYIQIAKTLPVLQRTIDALGIDMAPEALELFTSASIIQGTQIIQVSVVDPNPAQAQALANELGRQLTLAGPAAAEQEQAKRRAFAQVQAEDLQKKIETAQTQITDLNTQVQSTNSAIEIADKQQQITTLQNQVNQWQQTYTALLTFLAPQSPNYLSFLEPASLPTFPIAPNVFQSVLVAAAIGFILALGGVFLVEFLDDRFKSLDEVPQLLQLPTLGSIARIPRADQKLITSLPPRSPVAESYRILRTNIQFSGVDHPAKSILVTSPGPGEGKSVTSANLAIVMAQAGLRTILIDADLHKPALHRMFGVTNDVGLTNGLIASANVESFVRQTKFENLRLITTGTVPPNPTEILGSERMRTFLQDLKADSDIVIFDTPPCLPLADSAVLARQVDGVILVLDVPQVRRQAAVRAKESLEKVGGHIFGTVLNRINPRELGYAYQYSYSTNQRERIKRDLTIGTDPKILLQRIRALVRH